METGVLVHPQELSEKWISRTVQGGITTLGLHPVGGPGSCGSLNDLLECLRKPSFRRMIDDAAMQGLKIEYEMHASDYLLDRSLFCTDPTLFRMDKTQTRTPDGNFCVTNARALQIFADNARQLAKSLYRSEKRFYFWMDDSTDKYCCCPNCRSYSPAEQQLIALNAAITEIRKEIPEAKLAYLAYYDSLQVPKQIKPLPGIFLEYAPLYKYHASGPDKDRLIQYEFDQLRPLLQFFGTADSKVLEYWLDNSAFSNWTKPPRRFAAHKDTVLQDIRTYRSLGFSNIATFACYLGEDYEALYGAPDITPYTQALKESENVLL